MGSEAPGEGAEVASVASDGPAVDGTLDGPGRQITLAIIAVPLEAGNLVPAVLRGWERLRNSQLS